MRILLTGAAGFIGSHLTDGLLARGHRVMGVDNLSVGRIENLAQAQANANFTFQQADLCDRLAISTLLKAPPCQAVVFCASAGSPNLAQHDPLRFERPIVSGLVSFLEALKETGPRRVIFLSSHAAAPGSRPTLHGTILRGAEVFLGTFSELYGISVQVVRLPLIYGPRQQPVDGEFTIPTLLRIVRAGRPVPYAGRSVELLHVDDAVAGIAAVLQRDPEPFRVWTLAPEHAIDEPRLMATIEKACGKEPEGIPPETTPLPATPCTEARAELSWAPSIGLEDGIAVLAAKSATS